MPNFGIFQSKLCCSSLHHICAQYSRHLPSSTTSNPYLSPAWHQGLGSAMASMVAIGIALGSLGSIAINTGNNLQSLGMAQLEMKDHEEVRASPLGFTSQQLFSPSSCEHSVTCSCILGNCAMRLSEYEYFNSLNDVSEAKGFFDFLLNVKLEHCRGPYRPCVVLQHTLTAAGEA